MIAENENNQISLDITDIQFQGQEKSHQYFEVQKEKQSIVNHMKHI